MLVATENYMQFKLCFESKVFKWKWALEQVSLKPFIQQLILTSQFKVYVGISPQIMITCLGLFFMVLSEVFKIAKAAKEENELTV